jgi:hypothetical protein
MRRLLAIGTACSCLLVFPLAASPATTWTVIASPNYNTDVHHLQSVSAPSASDAWAVGWYRNTAGQYRTLAEHWNGTSWRLVAAPSVGSNSNFLNGVAALSATNAWAVGYYLNASFVNRPLIEHWDGTRWSVVPSPNPGTGSFSLSAVAALSATDVWAFGGGPSPLIEHWNGSSWTIVPGAAVSAASANLAAAAVVTASDIWAVGRTTQGYGGSNGLAEHWNGRTWTLGSVAPVDSSLNGATNAGGTLWSVGGQARSTRTLAERFASGAWSVVPTPTPATTASLNAATSRSATDVWAVGTQYSNPQTLIEHWNGATWTTSASPTVGTTALLSGVAAAPGGTLWAVGGDYPAAGRQEQTLILRGSG